MIQGNETSSTETAKDSDFAAVIGLAFAQCNGAFIRRSFVERVGSQWAFWQPVDVHDGDNSSYCPTSVDFPKMLLIGEQRTRVKLECRVGVGTMQLDGRCGLAGRLLTATLLAC